MLALVGSLLTVHLVGALAVRGVGLRDGWWALALAAVALAPVTFLVSAAAGIPTGALAGALLAAGVAAAALHVRPPAGEPPGLGDDGPAP